MVITRFNSTDEKQYVFFRTHLERKLYPAKRSWKNLVLLSKIFVGFYYGLSGWPLTVGSHTYRSVCFIFSNCKLDKEFGSIFHPRHSGLVADILSALVLLSRLTKTAIEKQTLTLITSFVAVVFFLLLVNEFLAVLY